MSFVALTVDLRLSPSCELQIRVFFSFVVHKVVGAVDGSEAMDVDVDSAKNNSNSEDSKTNESEKEKGKRKLYVGSQALNYRRDHMEVISFSPLLINVYNCEVFSELQVVFSVNRYCHPLKMA